MNKQCPYALYLARLSHNSKRSVQAQLESIAVVMNWPLSQLPEMLVSIDYAQALIIQNKLILYNERLRIINADKHLG